MLTTWKQTRTTVEYPRAICGSSSRRDNEEETTKTKRKSKKSKSDVGNDDAVTSSNIDQDIGIMGAQFIPQLSHQSSRESATSSSLGKSSKKRRKMSNNDAAMMMEKEPILCITSPHRVVFMENKGERGSITMNDGSSSMSMIESKSRTYVARPGTSSRFTLNSGNNVGKKFASSSSEDDDNDNSGAAFAGMIPPGAHFDPTSNLMYAIRNDGAEVAIWSAVPSSILPGPDDDVMDVDGAGTRINGGGSSGRKTGSAHESSSSSADAIISIRLKLPGGKNAVTLTPFSIPASSSSLGGSKKETLGAVGAVGCCEDGSIWLAIRRQSADGKCSAFQILLVDGLSNEVAEPESATMSSGVKAKKRRKPTDASVNKGRCRVFDSNATGTVVDKASLCISFQSVLLSEDSAQVVYRSHQLRIDNKVVDSDAHTSVRSERSTTQTIMQLNNSASDIAAKLDPDDDSLLVVHNECDGRWQVTSVKLSVSDCALIDSMRTFPLPNDGINGAVVYSFGMLGRNIVAVLMKSQFSKSHASVMRLRIIDFRRKAELSSMFWLEGDTTGIDEAELCFKDSPRIKLLNDKRCHAMVTNASNGSIALLTTTNENTGLLHIVYSKLEMSSAAGVDNAPSALDCTSLASALRYAALSGPSQTLNIGNAKSRESELCVERKAGDDAFDEACKLLTYSAKELIQHTGSSTVGNGAVTNGKSRKGSKSTGKNSMISWTKVYQDCCTLLTNASGKGMDQSKLLVNGIKGGATKISSVEVPKAFYELAFTETTNILLSLHRAGSPIIITSDVQEVIHDAASVLLEVLQTKLISSRRDYGITFNSREHVFLSVLHACPGSSLAEDAHRTTGKLHVMNAILENVQDIPEGVLVSILRFLLRNVIVEDVLAYYPTAPDASDRVVKLLNKYNAKSPSDALEERRNRIGIKLLSEAVLDFTSKIVTYSKCNQSFLTNAIRASINNSGEVETLLMTLAKLLRLGRPRLVQGDCDAVPLQTCGPFLGTIQWITALTDAHMCTILKISNEGGMVIDRIQHAVRSAMAQSEFAYEVKELLNLFSVVDEESTNREAKQNTPFSMPRETAVLPYTVERLAF